tara:strand:+ start:1277 stop:2857 length:1581 start_codon:yes stop_codon:yes gene_type:complete
MIKNKNLLYVVFIFFYLIIGIYSSSINGITSDESFEQLNWEKNLSGIKSLVKNGNYDNFLEYQDRYHGIAFHYISQPIQHLTHKLILKLNDVSPFGAHLISKHSSVFLIFFVSGIFFYLSCLKLTNNKSFSLISSFIYLLYPYLYGHSQFNMKDIPFLSFWLISTYYFLSIIEDIFYDKEIKLSKIILVSFLTSFLISIRVLGLIIFLQYLISFIILFNLKNINLINFIKKNYRKILTLSFSIFLFIYLMNPILWLNPLELVNAIKWMSNYFNNICTLTLGECMSSLSLPSSYYFIWLFFKLPIFIIFGIALFPFVEKNFFKKNVQSIFYGTFLISSISIIIIFILMRINIYDELRHIMFILPMIFLFSLTNIYYFNKNIFYTLSLIVILFFVLENISLKPYQYTWLNSFSKFTDIEKNFEIDYWGISNKNLNNKLVKYVNQNSISKDICVYGDEYAKEFLITKGFNCFKRYNELDSAKVRPAIAYKNLRNAKRSDPRDCKLIWNETYSYSFYDKDVSVGTLWLCD